MKFIVDQQLPPALVGWLKAHGHETEHVRDIGLRDASDALIWERALAHGAVIITKDEDFSVRRATAATGPTIVWVRIGNVTTQALHGLLEASWSDNEDAVNLGASIVEVR